jgi:hypothetical protein
MGMTAVEVLARPGARPRSETSSIDPRFHHDPDGLSAAQAGTDSLGITRLAKPEKS